MVKNERWDVADECKDGYHKACPGTPARKGGVGILCNCSCHTKK